MDGTIASAVVLPESEPQETGDREHAVSPTRQKRRQSSVSDIDPKRPRLNSIDANTSIDRRPSVTGKPAPDPSTGRRERGRERRLFGAALGALSQNSATAAQRKRVEIEKRQKAQRQVEEEESDQRKLERKARLKGQRLKEQKRFERDVMRTCHENLRHMAHFLQTEAQPRLYYKPWETTAAEEDLIQDQIADAEDIIRREQKEYDDREQAEEERERNASRNTDAERDAGAALIGKELNADAPQQQSTANGATNDSGPSPNNPERKEDHHAQDITNEAVSGEQAAEPDTHPIPASHDAAADEEASKDTPDENGEEMVEATEDTVIY